MVARHEHAAQLVAVLSQTANAAWELSAGRFFLIHSLRKMGDFVKMKTSAQRFIREAQQRGNVYGSTTLSRLCNILWLVDDDPGGAREELKKDLWLPYSQGYHSQHWLELNALVEIAIYEGSSVDKDFVLEHVTAPCRVRSTAGSRDRMPSRSDGYRGRAVPGPVDGGLG